MFNDPKYIHLSPHTFFVTKFRETFQNQTHTQNLSGSQKLVGRATHEEVIFAVFCTTQGCGISRKIFDSCPTLPSQKGAFYKFQVYFTVRRILYQLGGIQAISALPDDPKFNQLNINYDVDSYKRLCDEFGINPSSDFCFTHRANHGQESLYDHGSL